MKKCVICKKELTGIKTKFCSDTCYLKNKSEKAKRQVQLMRRRNPARKCSICEIEFFPVRETHYTCGKSCSKERARQHQQKRRNSSRPMKRVRPMDSPKAFPFQTSETNPLKIELKTSASFSLNDSTKDEVQAFLDAGGKIKKLPDEPAKKTPSVNIQFEVISDE